ncbi:VPA1267 family protein [Tibeticola sp.]|uniref:VPA1267 family protein n=1 Tax=Tibeticola sp. TaxID=2005368 RepID=UPI0025CD7AC5|nr:VPA1267 family protein [Tibeticola sp.]
MASGQQVAEENVRRFTAWVASKTDDDFRSMVLRGVLSRTDIAAECGFAKSVLSQNPRIRDSLKDLEAGLRERGVLPKPAAEPAGGPVEPRTRQAEGVGSLRDAERLKRLEQENAGLRAELAEVKRALSRYAVLQEALAETGRLPR